VPNETFWDPAQPVEIMESGQLNQKVTVFKLLPTMKEIPGLHHTINQKN